MRPTSKLAGFRTQHIRDGGVRAHESERDEEADPEDTPFYLLESPEYIGVSETLEPEVLCVEVRQRHETAYGDECAEYPKQGGLEFKRLSPALSAPSVSEDAPYQGSCAEEGA